MKMRERWDENEKKMKIRWKWILDKDKMKMIKIYNKDEKKIKRKMEIKFAINICKVCSK